MAVTCERVTLDNGLTVVAEVDGGAHSAACGFFVKTGARDEADEVMGVSHFLEHMMFKGTETRSADDINRAFDEIGARHNAYTTSEITVFHAQTLPERLAEAVDVLADMLRPALREEDFTLEKNVILEEIAMYADQPFWALYEKVCEARYSGHGLGHRVLGTKETISALPVEAMRSYFTARYSADNAIVALAGNLDFEACAGQIERVCGGWARTGAARDVETPGAARERVVMVDERVSRCYLLGLAPAPAAQDEARYAASVLAAAVGDPDTGRLYRALIEPGLADEAHCSFEGHDGSGDWAVYASCDPERADEVWTTLVREVESAAQSLTEEDLERVKAKAATGVTVAGERPGGRMQRLGRLWAYFGAYRPLEEELARLEAVTLGDVRDVAQRWPLTPIAAGRLSPT